MYVSGSAANVFDLLEAIDELLQNVGWIRRSHDVVTYGGVQRTCFCMWEGHGEGNDKIYIQARVPADNITDLYLDSMAGYDNLLDYYEQPGSIQQWLKSYGEQEVRQPMFTVTGNQRFYYWLFANTYRIVGITRMSIVYESFYLGFINPISSERQYPYPMYVAGNGVATEGSWPNNQPGSFVFPNNNSGFIRRPDGVWVALDAQPPEPSPTAVGTIFPYNAHNTKLVPNYKEKDALNQDNYLLIPIFLQTNNPIDVCGILREVYWVSGTRDIAAEQIIVYNSNQFMVFDTKQLRGNNTYFCVCIE